MSALEIVLLIAGVIIFVLGYFMPVRKKDMDDEVRLISEDEIRRLISQETGEVHKQISDTVDEGVKYAMENTERSMEKLSNEKIMAINEYADTVLEEINKNHKEVVFLYDMLNDKHDNLVNTISEMSVKSDEIAQTVKDAEISAQEMAGKVSDIQREVQDTIQKIEAAEESVREVQANMEEAVNHVMDAVERAEEKANALHEAELRRKEAAKEAAKEVEKAKKTKEKREAKAAAEVKEPVEEDTFKPISPKRVEIIHEEDGDYIAPEESQETETKKSGETKAAEEKDEPTAAPKQARKPRRKPAVKKENVDIQFAQGNEGARNSNERILELHKAGKSNMAIAKELGLGLGEVKLVIDLFEGM